MSEERTVYLLSASHYAETDALGVYSTEAKALEARGAVIAAWHRYDEYADTVDVSAFTLDAEPRTPDLL